MKQVFYCSTQNLIGGRASQTYQFLLYNTCHLDNLYLNSYVGKNNLNEG